MRYQITVWELDHNDSPDNRFECYCETYNNALAVFDTLTRGIRGHYKAWFVDLAEEREVRYSSVTYAGNGVS